MLKTRTLLKNSEMFSTFSVPDINQAKRFYGETLGLDVRNSSEPGIIEIHGKGGPPVTVYPKPDHKPAVFTVLNFPVDDVDSGGGRADGGRAWKFERYDSDSIKTDAKGIARGNGPSIAWFRDPAGNILSVMSRS